MTDAAEQMLLTPTYHVFDLYKVHHDATRLPIDLEAPEYKRGDQAIPALSVSASRGGDGATSVSIVNTHPSDAMTLECELQGVDAAKVEARVLGADRLDAHNSFADPDRLQPAAFDGAELADGKLSVRVPAASVVVVRLLAD